MLRLVSVLLVLFIACCCLGAPVAAQQGPSRPSRPCGAPEARQFDFWLGTWDLSWGEDGAGTNVVRRILDDCIVEERFEGELPDGLLVGRSVSVYDPQRGTWRQTWVDNQGAYLDFEGGLQEDGRMVLQREGVRDGEPVLQRMVWYDVSDDQLDWNWELSEDGGATWQVLWSIHYERRSGTEAATSTSH